MCFSVLWAVDEAASAHARASLASLGANGAALVAP